MIKERVTLAACKLEMPARGSAPLQGVMVGAYAESRENRTGLTIFSGKRLSERYDPEVD